MGARRGGENDVEIGEDLGGEEERRRGIVREINTRGEGVG